MQKHTEINIKSNKQTDPLKADTQIAKKLRLRMLN